MCGRYVTKLLRQLEESFEVEGGHWNFPDNFNVAPTQLVPVLRMEKGVRFACSMRWGLIPFFARGEPPRYSTINAQVERLESAAVWRGPWERAQRCILPASAFYEWHLDETTGEVDPWLLRVVDQETGFGFAGLWDSSYRSDGTRLQSCAIVTLPANELMADIHNSRVVKGRRALLPAAERRMPAILTFEGRRTWLEGPAAEARTVLEPYPSELMDAWRVSRRVNSVDNDDPSLTEPVASE